MGNKTISLSTLQEKLMRANKGSDNPKTLTGLISQNGKVIMSASNLTVQAGCVLVAECGAKIYYDGAKSIAFYETDSDVSANFGYGEADFHWFGIAYPSAQIYSIRSYDHVLSSG